VQAFRDEVAPKSVDLADPVAMFKSGLGVEPDPWQREVLVSDAPRIILLWARQSGKTTVVSAKASWLAQSRAQTTVVICSGRVEQAKHLLRSCRRFSAKGSSVSATSTELTIRFRNQSELVVVPASDTARGLSAGLLCVEEGSVVPDDVFDSVLLPMVSQTRGQVIALGTPGSEAGWFWETWTNAPRWDSAKPASGHSWLKSLRTWEECDRLDPWLASELRDRSPHAYRTELLCEFAGATDALFDPDHVREMVTEEFEPTHFLETL
jgi:hypothetical protein